jgi:hypothetical protein
VVDVYGLRFLAVMIGLTVLAFWAFHERPTPKVRVRTVAFDNLYGNVDRLPVQVKVDGGAEYPTAAACDAKTCTFSIPLTNARHELEISIEHGGQRSAPTRVTLDTSNLR